MDIHIQIKSGSYLYIQLLPCSLCFLQKMDTLAFSKIFYGVHIHCSSKQIKTSVSCSCNSEVFFFVYLCTCSYFVNCIHIFKKVRSFCIFKGKFDMHLIQKKTSTDVQIFIGSFCVVQFYHFLNESP